jgi:hypothetical protein
MAYRNKTYIAFDADTDIKQYYLMTAWNANDDIDFNFHNAHELNNLRANTSENQIKLKLKERLKNTKLMIVLLGENTKNLYKYVRWEMEVGLEMGLPIVVVNLNNHSSVDYDLCPKILKEELALHIKYKQKAITWAIDNWIDIHNSLLKEGVSNSRILGEDYYKNNGI